MDLNHGPPGCEPSALTSELYAQRHFLSFYITILTLFFKRKTPSKEGVYQKVKESIFT